MGQKWVREAWYWPGRSADAIHASKEEKTLMEAIRPAYLREVSQRCTPIIVVAVLTATICSQASAQLITNGSFEQGSFVPDGNHLMSLPVGSTVITGWTTINAEIIWGNNSNPFVSPASNGSMFLDLTGYHDSSPYGGVKQTVTLVTGQSYKMTFDAGVKQGSGVYAGPVTIRATATGVASQDFTYNPPGTGTLWGTMEYDFVATAASTDISFLGITSGGGQYIGLDNVAIAPVPEPICFPILFIAAPLLRLRRLSRKSDRVP
jgi:hypothetical protein